VRLFGFMFAIGMFTLTLEANGIGAFSLEIDIGFNTPRFTSEPNSFFGSAYGKSSILLVLLLRSAIGSYDNTSLLFVSALLS
jgi:hypothetical protein